MGSRLTRRSVVVGAAAVAVVGGGARAAYASALSYPDGSSGLRFRFGSLEEAMAEVRRRAAAQPVTTTGAWKWAQILEHCAQSIEYSLTGYPENKPELIQRTVGRLVHGRFASQGYMKHDLAATIPGAPALKNLTDETAALGRLEAAVTAFRNQREKLAPHFVYGALSHDEYDRVQAMHLANHLSELAG